MQTVERFDAEVRVTRGSETVGGTSIMGLMMLAASPGHVDHASTPPAARPPTSLRRSKQLLAGRFGEDE